ncbi:LuxR C-terminal-related transcriptional regulator [Rhodoluna sp. KAS3]|uniref:LuxR C-terminal-related transcriptional regulator n=1 Tax=Rhodoluna sp. KAS3 TaxID=942880 RepID=UPI0022304E90|nr:LuxR C-terminal-related transcriptional regulator [Rhodoluna sp. KAS3]
MRELIFWTEGLSNQQLTLGTSLSQLKSEPLATAKYLFESLGNSLDADTFCKGLVHYLHEGYGAIACFITRVDKEAKIRWVGRYGYEVDTANVAKISLWESSASAMAILSGSSLVIKSSDEYKAMFEVSQLEHSIGIGFLSIPLKHQGQAIGSLGISFASKISGDLAADETFDVLAVGASAYLTSLASRGDSGAGDLELLDDTQITSRDLQILTLMEEGLTHYEIGRVLNLSESSIKQTSSMLYKKLGVSKRSDAIDQAKLLRLI